MRAVTSWALTEPVPASMLSNEPAYGDLVRRRIAYYLITAPAIFVTELSMDDVRDGEDPALSRSVRCDNDWYWPEDLGFYVLKYRLHLPPEFLDHAEQNQWYPDYALSRTAKEAQQQVLQVADERDQDWLRTAVRSVENDEVPRAQQWTS